MPPPANLWRRPSQAQQRCQRGPAINAQTAHADGDRRAFDHETSGWVLVAEAGEEAADEQRGQRVAGSQERRCQRSQGQSQDGQRKPQFHDPVHITLLYH